MSKKHYDKNSDDVCEKKYLILPGYIRQKRDERRAQWSHFKIDYSGAKIVMIRLLRITDTLWLNYFNFGSNFY